MNDSELVAHIKPDGCSQSLVDHLSGVSSYAAAYGSELGLTNCGRILGLVHDLGKASEQFQSYIRGESGDGRGDVDHSTAGAQHLIKSARKSSTEARGSFMLSLAIVSHHSGLIDCLDAEGEDIFGRRMGKSNLLTHLDEAESIIDEHLLEKIDSLLPEASEEIDVFLRKTLADAKRDGIGDNGAFRAGLLQKMLLSILMDADHRDTRDFIYGKRLYDTVPLEVLKDRLETHLKGFSRDSPVDAIRGKVSDECLNASRCPPGVFTLTVPTGGGKTLSSLRFALNHAILHGMKRIIYVIPYTSIIDQNADVIREIIERSGEHVVLEYHSNIDISKDDSETNIWRYNSDSWDSPVILTTMVQFLDALYSKGSGHTKKMHNLSNSVLIFDEVQSVPTKCIYMFNEAVNFLVEECGSTAVLCSATQPTLQDISGYPIVRPREIIENPGSLYLSLKRTSITVDEPLVPRSAEYIRDVVLSKLDSNQSILIITNTKGLARKLFAELADSIPSDVNLYHLSTNMCPAHRRATLNALKRSLSESRTVCVSTQLIEAGVDIDFNCVIRMMAGLDSIVQASGRCNRNGLMDRPGEVIVMRGDENLSPLRDINEGCTVSKDVIPHHPGDIDGLESISEYFMQYYQNKYSYRDFEYLTDNPSRSLFSILSMNASSISTYMTKHGAPPNLLLYQSFNEASSEFEVIGHTDSVIVPYDDEARDLISWFFSDEFSPEEIPMRKVQSYSINVYDVEDMVRRGIARRVSDECDMYVLLESYYDSRWGLSDKPESKTMIFRGSQCSTQ